ncbi:MAG: hypothetical protein IPN76_00100 [Saprospiraceae bacterium]|nr:hypothetical protein [Saprospiraceae bacterium]
MKEESINETDTSFGHIAHFPIIKDTTQFISDLRKFLNLEIHESPIQRDSEQITAYKKTRIFGSERDYFIIEYDWKEGPMAGFPWKYQVLLTADGKPLKVFSGQRFELLEVFKGENPFLLITIVSSRGNGGHELYGIKNDSFENIYEGYFDYELKTYDDHQDNMIYEPNELIITLKDDNQDGHNDILFNGNVLYIMGLTDKGIWYESEVINGKEIIYSIDNPFKRIPVEFIFLFDKQTGHFKSKENYVENTA